MWRGNEEKGKRAKLKLLVEHVVRELGGLQLTCKYSTEGSGRAAYGVGQAFFNPTRSEFYQFCSEGLEASPCLSCGFTEKRRCH